MSEVRLPKVGDMVLFTGPEVFNGSRRNPAIVIQRFLNGDGIEGKYSNLKVLAYGSVHDEGSVSHKSDCREEVARYWEWPDEV